MADQKKKGILSRLFGPSKSCCCDMKIEEVPDAQTPTSQQSTGPSCCGEKQEDGKTPDGQSPRPDTHP